MKTQVIPAQITTVEDKIVGSLTFSQLLLLLTPVALVALIYAFMPPLMELAWYKVGLVLSLSLPLIVLAIRVRGVVMLDWVQLVGRYVLRPRLYVADKNDPEGRQVPRPEKVVHPVSAKKLSKPPRLIINPTAASLRTFEYQLSQKQVALRVVPTAKGGVHVVLG